MTRHEAAYAAMLADKSVRELRNLVKKIQPNSEERLSKGTLIFILLANKFVIEEEY